MFRTNINVYRFGVLPVLLVLALAATVLAQNIPKTITPSFNEKRSVLDLLRYNPKSQGPLLVVSPNNGLLEYDLKFEPRLKQEIGGKTPTQFAAQRDLRVVTAGEITALVPRTMKEIVTNPGPPDPYAGMRFDQRFVLVLATLTHAQWKQAGSGNGIGLNDLSQEQRSLFTGIWGARAIALRTIRTPKDGAPEISESGSVAVSNIRFRLSRRVSLRFKAIKGNGGFGLQVGGTGDASKGEPQDDGSSVRQELTMPRTDQGTNGDTVAFGVPVIRTVPNRLKEGQLDLDTPALNVGIRLDGSHKTVGALLDAIALTTHFRLVADKRLAVLPIGYRLAPGGQMVSTGDVLRILCRSVTGTFRRLNGPGGETVYLLTDDVTGIGTRFARLARWAHAAYRNRTEIYEKALDDCAAREPLDTLGFAPGYEHALSADQLKKIDDTYRSGDWMSYVLTPVSQLSPALREEVKHDLEIGAHSIESSGSVQTDKVGLDTDFHCDWIVPGGKTIPAQFDSALGFTFLRQIAVPKAQRKTPGPNRSYPNPIPSRFPSRLKRRIVTIPPPATETEAAAFFALLARKGFNEAWLRVSDSTPATQERLQKAIMIGAKQNVRVGVVIPWLLKEAVRGATPDINILGETGAEWVEATLLPIRDKAVSEQERLRFANLNAGWVIPETRNVPGIVQSVSPFLKITDLSAVVFTNTAPPGYRAADAHGNDGIAIDGRLGYVYGPLGYNEPFRFRCVQEKGFDPVDVATSSYYLDVPVDLPLFRASGMAKPLADLRVEESKAHLAHLYEAIRSQFPQARFYLDAEGMENLTFYGLWTKPSRFSGSESQYINEPSQLRERAFRESPAPLFSFTGVPMPNADVAYWNNWHDGAEEAANGWGGFSLNMATLASEDVLAVLQALPDEPVPSQ